jgi:hypothetical protein
MAHGVEHLPGKFKALSLNPTTAKKEDKKSKMEKRWSTQSTAVRAAGPGRGGA